MKFRMVVAALIVQIVFCQPASSQQRGGGLRVVLTGADGSRQEVQLYDGSYALVIGNSEYSQGWEKLSGVKSDVVAVKGVLEKHGFKVEVEENLTSEELVRRVKKFINDYGYERDNRLLVYYAGHGYTLKSAGDSRELGYVIPADTPLPTRDERGFRQKAVSMYEIQTFAKEIQAKHALFVFDSCFSGRLFALRNAPKLTPFIVDKVNYPVRQFITAGDETQSVPDESSFRKAFVRGLEGDADRNGDTYITGIELAEYLKEAVTNYTNRRLTPQYGTLNDIDLDRGDFVFVVPNKNTVSPAALAWNNFRGLAKSLMKYDEIGLMSDGLAWAYVYSGHGNYGFIDKAGNEVIPLKYNGVPYSFSEGLAAVELNGKYGFIDTADKMIIPPVYDSVTPFSDGLASVSLNGKNSFIDKKGREVVARKYEDVGAIAEGLAPTREAGRAGYVDKTGKIVIPLEYDYASPFSEGFALVEKGELQGYIDRTGRAITPLKYEDDLCGIGNSLFAGGIAQVIVNRKYGFIDTKGREIIPPKYDKIWCNAFRKDGFVGVMLNGRKGFVDIYGNEYFDL